MTPTQKPDQKKATPKIPEPDPGATETTLPEDRGVLVYLCRRCDQEIRPHEIADDAHAARTLLDAGEIETLDGAKVGPQIFHRCLDHANGFADLIGIEPAAWDQGKGASS